MARKIIWRRKPCPVCGDRVTVNALGRAAHIRHCTGKPRPDPAPRRVAPAKEPTP
jgi:hypothetical protein